MLPINRSRTLCAIKCPRAAQRSSAGLHIVQQQSTVQLSGCSPAVVAHWWSTLFCPG